MRKQDRVAAQHQDSREQTHDTRQPDRPQPERVKGSASNEGTSHPPHQGNKMPLPE